MYIYPHIVHTPVSIIRVTMKTTMITFRSRTCMACINYRYRHDIDIEINIDIDKYRYRYRDR